VLRLHLTELLPWVDSKWNLRPPGAEFRLLDESARIQVSQEGDMFTLWEIGVLADDWEHPESAKPVAVGSDDNESPLVTGYALGENASMHFPELEPLLVSIIDFVRLDDPGRWFFADSFWNPGKTVSDPIADRLLNFAQAARGRMVAADELVLQQVGHSRMFSARPTRAELERLFASWWPSTAEGFLGAIMADGVSEGLDERLSNTGLLRGADLPYTSCVIQTSQSFDHLGFSVLSRNRNWAQIRAGLARQGWSDGSPIDFLAPLSA
jgi:hypothetical protein